MRFSETLDFKIEAIEVNRTGNLLVIIGFHNVSVANISNLSRISKIYKILHNLNLADKVQVKKVSWHPLSDNHLVILTSDNVLRIINVSKGHWNLLEQKYHLDKNLIIISFAFGQIKPSSWQTFTIYFITQDSKIYAICPIVPIDINLPKNLFDNLSQSNLFFQEITQNTNDSGFLLTCHPKKSMELFLQGPMSIYCSESDEKYKFVSKNSFVSDFFSITTHPFVFVVCYYSGHAQVLIQCDHDIKPFWKGLKTPQLSNFIQWVGIDLSLDLKDSNTLQKNSTSLSQLLSIKTKDKFYLYSKFGIFQINIPWILTLNNFLLNKQNRSELPQTTVDFLYNSITAQNKNSNTLGMIALGNFQVYKKIPVLILNQFSDSQVKLSNTLIDIHSSFESNRNISIPPRINSFSFAETEFEEIAKNPLNFLFLKKHLQSFKTCQNQIHDLEKNIDLTYDNLNEQSNLNLYELNSLEEQFQKIIKIDQNEKELWEMIEENQNKLVERLNIIKNIFINSRRR